MVKSASGSPKARMLGAELRECRERAGLSVRALARQLGVAHVRVSRYEGGTSVPAPEEVANYLAAVEASETDRARIVSLVHELGEPSWLTSPTPGVHRDLTTLIEFERTATDITDVAPLLIPALLQTSDYTRALLTGLTPGEVEQRVMLRAGRREVLNGRMPPRLTAFISEAALREPIGGPEVMADQLRALVKLGRKANVGIHVIRSGARRSHPAHSGPFVLFEFSKAAPIVHLASFSSTAFRYGARDVRAYTHARDELREHVLPPRESRDFIVGCVEQLEAGDDRDSGAA